MHEIKLEKVRATTLIQCDCLSLSYTIAGQSVAMTPARSLTSWLLLTSLADEECGYIKTYCTVGVRVFVCVCGPDGGLGQHD